MKRGSLAEERPKLVPQWDTSNSISPYDVSCGSHKKVWWVCDKGHKWEAVVKNRALKGSGCPYCEHRAVLKGDNDLKTLYPKIARTWSPNNTIRPTEVSPSSNTEVLWLCSKGHEWKARIADRTAGHGCPYCAGHRVWKGFNDLATTHPEIVTEWSEKNKNISPDTITYKNRSKVWWHCKICGNEYQLVVYTKAQGGYCPYCLANSIKIMREQRLFNRKVAKDFACLLPELAVIYYAGKRGYNVYIDSDNFIGIPVTAHIPSLRLIIDVCSDDREMRVKELICNINEVRYFSIPVKISERETIDYIRKAFIESHIYLSSNADEDLETIRASFTKWKNEACKSSP